MSKNKRRGSDFERQVVEAFKSYGLECARVFGSGAYKKELGEAFAGDVKLEGKIIECKRSKTKHKQIMSYFEQDNADIVAIKLDRHEPVFIMKKELLAELFLAKRENKNDVEPKRCRAGQSD
tara:strand:- start:851 stop:1216 length:366 start_codon:yes stop_codon:yes gene_type:complete